MKTVKLVALSIACALVVAACGGDDTPKAAGAQSSSAPAAAASASAKPASDSGYGGGKSNGSSRLELQEGITTQSDTDYTTSKLEPRVTFHTPDLAYPFFPEVEAPRGLFFNTESGGLIIFRPAKVFDPATGKLAAAPGDLTEWVTANDHLHAGAVEPVTVAGLKGAQVDAAVISTVGKGGDCELSCIRMAPVTARDSVWFAKSDQFRLISVTYKGAAIGIVEVSNKAGYHQLRSSANKLLKTLRFH